MEKITDVPFPGQISVSLAGDRAFFAAVTYSVFMHGKKGREHFPLLASVISFCNIAAAVITGTVFLTVFCRFFHAFTDGRHGSGKVSKEPRSQACMMQMVDS